jgi:hypothetical protein
MAYWELWSGQQKLISKRAEREARDLVRINADPVVWVREYTGSVQTHDHQYTGNEVHWADVCSEPWPSYPDESPDGDPNYPYGAPPPDWPYGNGC